MVSHTFLIRHSIKYNKVDANFYFLGDMLVNERKDPYRIRIPVIWDEINEIKRRLVKLESKSDTYDEFWEIRTLGELDNLIRAIWKDLKNHG